MGLLDAIRAGVAVANTITKPDLQTTIGYRRYVSSDGEGLITYSPPIGQPAASLKVILEQKIRSVKTRGGKDAVSTATMTFLDVAALTAAAIATSRARAGELDVEDMIILPDDTTQPLLNTGGFIDSGTGVPVATEAYLG